LSGTSRHSNNANQQLLKTKNYGDSFLNTQDSSHIQNPAASNWQILAEFELPVGTIADDTLRIRLKEILDPLELHEDFVNRILNSAQQTAARILQADAEIKLEHICLLVFVPSRHASQKQIWGFFSVEKLEDTKDGAVTNEHTIEIYLYAEGDAIPRPENK
jgi:hypothetical protein